MPDNLPVRKTSPGLKNYIYSSPGMYFVTINTHKNIPIFGQITQGEMQLNPAGKIVQNTWQNLPNTYPGIQIDTFIVMPNHLHGILFLIDGTPNTNSVSQIIRGFKTWTARKINELQDKKGSPIWQRSFYDHVIRDERSLEKIQEYIVNNPLKGEITKGYHSYDELFK
jgi:REP element-mobilizing transposase RayT